MFEKTISQRIQMIANNREQSTLIRGQLNARQVRALCFALRKNTVLTTLFLQEGAFSNEQWGGVFDALRCHPKLEFLEIGHYQSLTLPSSFKKFVQECPNLTEIAISDARLSNTDVRLLFESIKGEKIKVVRLYSIEGCNDDVLLENTIDLLPECVVEKIRLPISSLDIDQSKRLSKALLQNNSLISLGFSDSDTVLQSSALQPLLDVFSQKPNIRYLTLGLLADEGDYYRLADFLSRNASVWRLSISNELNPKMLNYMIDKIKGKNTTLVGFIYKCHFRGLTEREFDRFKYYERYLDNLTDINKRQMELRQSEASEQKKRKF